MILGFPAERVLREGPYPASGGFWGLIRVGETLPLTLAPPAGASAVKGVTWTISDPWVASVTPFSLLSAALTGLAPGELSLRAEVVFEDGSRLFAEVWAEGPGQASRVSRLRVLP